MSILTWTLPHQTLLPKCFCWLLASLLQVSASISSLSICRYIMFSVLQPSSAPSAFTKIKLTLLSIYLFFKINESTLKKILGLPIDMDPHCYCSIISLEVFQYCFLYWVTRSNIMVTYFKTTELIIFLFSEQFAVSGLLSIISGKISAKPFVSMKAIKLQLVGTEWTSELILLINSILSFWEMKLRTS